MHGITITLEAYGVLRIRLQCSQPPEAGFTLNAFFVPHDYTQELSTAKVGVLKVYLTLIVSVYNPKRATSVQHFEIKFKFSSF